MRHVLLTVCCVAIAATAFAQAPKLGYDDTPMQPNGKWHIHDGIRPQPRIVTPGAAVGAEAPPSDAIVLIGKGSDLSAWQTSAGEAAPWAMGKPLYWSSNVSYLQTYNRTR